MTLHSLLKTYLCPVYVEVTKLFYILTSPKFEVVPIGKLKVKNQKHRFYLFTSRPVTFLLKKTGYFQEQPVF